MSFSRSLVVMVVAGLAPMAHAQVVPGYSVTTYATVTDPVGLTFNASGIMFSGRDNSGSGGGNADAVKIHRIGAGGAPVVEYGNASIPDPDVVGYDAVGTVSGLAGSVLVGGWNGSMGVISVIRPDQSVTPLYSGGVLENPVQVRFTPAGVLWLGDVDINNPDNQGFVLRTAGGALQQIDTHTPGPSAITFAPNGDVYIAARNGRVRIYDSAGVKLDDNWTDIGGASAMNFAPGGVWGTDLYAIAFAGGNLLRVNSDGTTTVVGTGFPAVNDLVFGPDGAMYLSSLSQDRVIRVGECESPLDCNSNGVPDACDPNHCAADLAAPFGVLNVFDFLAYQTAFSNQNPCADLAAPFGSFNVFDFLAYQTAFGNGC